MVFHQNGNFFFKKMYKLRCYYFKNWILTYKIFFSQKFTNSVEPGIGRLLLIFGKTKKDKCKSFLEQFTDFREKYLYPTLSILKF